MKLLKSTRFVVFVALAMLAAVLGGTLSAQAPAVLQTDTPATWRTRTADDVPGSVGEVVSRASDAGTGGHRHPAAVRHRGRIVGSER